MDKTLITNISTLKPEDLSIIGITTTMNGFSLASKINKLIFTKLTLNKDFESYKPENKRTCYFKHYYYFYPPYRLHNFLLSNHNSEGCFLFETLNMYDFVYVLMGRDNVQYAQNFINKVRLLDNVLLVKLIDTTGQEEQPLEKSVTKVQVLDMFEVVTCMPKTKSVKKKTRPKKIDFSSFFEDICFNLDNIMNEHRLFLAFKTLLPDVMIARAKSFCYSLSTLPYEPTLQTNYHITLAFFGLVSTKRMRQIIAVSENILKNFRPIEIAFEGISYFVQPDGQIIFYFSLKESAELNALAQSLHRAYEQNNIHFDNQNFVPHISICKLFASVSQEQKHYVLRNVESMPSLRQKITLSAPILFESFSVGGAARYDIRTQF
jgi:2''-5'' RNA ligase